MTYEEKRQLYLAISQMLADAGLNKHTIKEIVEEEIRNKVNKAIEDVLRELDEKTYSHDYIRTKIDWVINDRYLTKSILEDAVKEEMKNRVIKVVISEDAKGSN